MKKRIILLLTILTTLNPLMSLHASNIEAQADAQHVQQMLASESERETGDDTDALTTSTEETVLSSEETTATDAEPTTDNARTQAEAPQEDLELSTLAGGRVVEGEFTYHLDQFNQVKYREHRTPSTNKVDYAEEYYPGTVYGRDNIVSGKKSIYIKMTNNQDEVVAYRARIDKNTQQWTEVEEYKRQLKWNYGFPYEYHLTIRIFVEGDKKVKFSYVYGNDWKTPTQRLDYYAGATYGEGHQWQEMLRNSQNWNIKDGDYRIFMNYLGEVKYIEHINPRTNRVVSATEYYPGTVYKRDNLNSGKKSIYIEMTNDRDQIVRYRARIDKNTQHWTEVEEYNRPLSWNYGFVYERYYKRRYFLSGANWTIRWMDEYSDDDAEFVDERVEYHSGTRFGDNHASKVAKRIPWKQYKPQPKPKWVTPVNGVGYIYCIFEQCTDGAYGGRHNGTDIPVPIGTGVQSIADGGTVTMSTTSPSLGEVIGVHYKVDGLDFYVVYAHLSQRWVKFGDVVSIGQTIGLSGNTGYSTGPHLHIEVQLHTWWFEGNPVERRNRSLPLSWIFGNYMGLGYKF